MDLLTSSPLFLIVTILSTYLMAFAYKNTKFILKHKVAVDYINQYLFLHNDFEFFIYQVAVKREEAVSREISKKMAEDKKMNKKEKDER